MGEPEYNDMRLREATTWIANHPKRFMELTAMRITAFWFPSETGTIHHYAGTGRRRERFIMYLMSLLSIGGILILYRQDINSFALSLFCLILFPLPYYTTQFLFWHSYPILWLIFLLGAFPITSYVGTRYQISRRAG
jgi:hypothetical protein